MNFLITGGSRGLGLAIAKWAKQFDGNIILLSKNAAHLEKAKQELAYKNVFSFACDFSNPLATQSTINEVLTLFPAIDVVINNVGYFEMGSLDDCTITAVDQMLNINFKAAFHTTQAYLPYLKKQKAGAIINIGSIVTEAPKKDFAAAYTISKFALQGYTKLLTDEMKDYGVKVTEIIPGSINTTSWDGIDVPKQEFVQPEDIVAMIDVVIKSSKGANFEQIIVRPTNRAF